MKSIKLRATVKGDAGIWNVQAIDWINQRVYLDGARANWHPMEKIKDFLQFTGITDVNDVDIFEGDIVRWSHEYESDCQKDCSDQEECKNPEHVGFIHGFQKGEVRFQDGGFIVDVQTDEWDMTILGWAMDHGFTFEVIGNYQNTKLLK